MPVLVEFLKDITPARLGGIIMAIIVFVALFVLFLSKLNDNEMVVLYSNLDIQDSAKIAEELDNRKVPYEVLFDGSTIKVNKEEMIRIRLSLAQLGMPTSGNIVGYEIFDQDDSIGATNFSQNVKLVRALEGELSRTIAAFDQVHKARVHLVMPQREIFSKERMDPRASIVLTFRGNKRLGNAEIDAISHLVVTSVPGLEMRNVTVVDTKGNALKIGASEDNLDLVSSKNEELKISTENRLKTVIENLLSSTLGNGKVKAQVSLEMNFDRTVTNSEIFDSEGAVVRSTQAIDEREQSPVGASSGDPSAANNIPGGGGGGDNAAIQFATSEKSDQTTNYEISKTIKNHISESGIISKMSIAILVDGIYSSDEGSGEEIYAPRSQEDLDKIANLVKVAVGFNSDRSDQIKVINMQFFSVADQLEEEAFDWIKEELPNIFQTLIFAIVVVLVLTTVIRPIALKAFEVRQAVNFGDEASNAMLGIIDAHGNVAGAPAGSVPGVNNLPGSEGYNGDDASMGGVMQKADHVGKVNAIAESNTEDLVNVLRQWVNDSG